MNPARESNPESSDGKRLLRGGRGDFMVSKRVQREEEGEEDDLTPTTRHSTP